MKIVDLETAQGLLHRTSRGPSLTTPPGVKQEPPPPAPPTSHHGPPPMGMGGGEPGFKPSWDQFQGPPPGGREDRGGRGGPPIPPPQGEYNRMRVSLNNHRALKLKKPTRLGLRTVVSSKSNCQTPNGVSTTEQAINFLLLQFCQKSILCILFCVFGYARVHALQPQSGKLSVKTTVLGS